MKKILGVLAWGFLSGLLACASPETVMSDRYCPEKMSPSLRTELARRDYFTVAVRVREGHGYRLRSYMEGLTLRGSIGVGRIEREKLLRLSCEPWVLHIDLLSRFPPQGERR
ncbi:MAG: hypothetical protein GXN96_01030 [Aquificae bacterium]|nr:hypothetical protein [Aquificota bacterium]